MVQMNSRNSSSMSRDSYYRNYNMDLEYPRKLHHRERRKTPEVRMAMSCVGCIWTFLSFLSMALSCVGFYLPFWLEGEMEDGTKSFIGTFRRCNYPRMTDHGEVKTVMECGRYAEFNDIPSLWWQVSTVIIGVGCGISILVSFTSLLSCCVEDVVSKTTAKVGGILQFVAGTLIGAGCLLYPLGWEAQEAKQICGPAAEIYNLGGCMISWAYYATIAGGSSAILCSFLSCNAVRLKAVYG